MHRSHGDMVCPGDCLGATDALVVGPGTFSRGKAIYASVVGPLSIKAQDGEGSTAAKKKSIVTVVQESYARAQDYVVEVGDVVMGKVTRLSTSQAYVEMLCVGQVVLREAYQGVIRKEDVRRTNVDRVDLNEAFRPGDIVRARVISLGDARQYYLSTAEAELGVRWAKEKSTGEILVPLSATEMQCPSTLEREPRKVAKPV